MNRTLKYALSAALSALIVVPALAQDNFPDVQESHWAYKDLLRMKQEGLLVGYPDGLFRGGRPASRYELAVACHAVWANLKGITDSLKSQIDDLNSKLANAATKADVDNLRSAIDALTAEVNRIKNEDIASLRRMADEFKSELTKMGADVDAMKKELDDMKGKVGWLWQHRLPFDVSGDANLWLGSAYSRNSATGGFGITVDGRPEGVKRGAGLFGGGPGSLTRALLNGEDLTGGTGYLRSGEVVLASDDDVFTSEAAGGGGFGGRDGQTDRRTDGSLCGEMGA
jgi:cytochrome c556